MRNYILFLLLLSLLTTSVSGSEAQNTSEKVRVQSWKTGNGTIIEKVHEIALSRNHKKVSVVVAGVGARKYILSVTYFPPTKRLLEYWHVDFREKLPSRPRSRLSEDLLLSSKPGPGGDYFPREDLIGYLYPRSDYDYLMAGTPWTDGAPFYSIDTVRQIRIEGFSVTLEVVKESLKKSVSVRWS